MLMQSDVYVIGMMIILAIDSPPTNHLTTQAEERIVLLFSTCICHPRVKGMCM